MVTEEKEEVHSHVVWKGKNTAGSEKSLAVKCRVFMGLEKGAGSQEDKAAGKTDGVFRHGVELSEEGRRGSGGGGHQTHPDILVCEEKCLPSEQHGRSDVKAGTELLNRRQVCKIFSQHPKNKEKPIGGVWYDKIR